MTDSELLTAALDYAARGWAVIPMHDTTRGHCSCGKPNCGSAGKHPRGTEHGFYDASTDPATIRSWWARWPHANIGIAVAASGLVHIDVDHKDGKTPGLESWRDLCQRYGQGIADTVTSETPTGGLHLLYKRNGQPIANDETVLGPGIEVKGTSGLFVAYPSVVNDKQYSWAMGCAPEEKALSPFPSCLAALLATPEAKSKKPAATVGDILVQGQRRPTLMSLAGTMRRRNMSAAEIEAALLVVNEQRCQPALPAEEVTKIAAGAMRYEPSGTLLLCTDLGNARRLVALHGQDMRYCERLGGWYVWDGRRWTLDTTGQVERFAKDLPAAIRTEADNASNDDERDDLNEGAVKAEALGRLRAAMELTKSEPEIAVTAEAFNRDPWLFNCANGTIDLRTGQLRPHDRNDLLTKLAPVSYDPKADLLLWREFLATVTRGDTDLQAFLQRCVGYSLTGSTTEERLFFVHGPAATGKSTFIEATKATLGEYAQTTNFDTFLARKQVGAPRNDLAALAGARLVASVEVDKGQRLAEGLVKQATGGDVIKARFLYCEEFEFRPQFKLWLVANDAPRAADDDSALWRRILRVPFEHTIPEAERDPNVKTTLCDPTQAGPAILAWAVQGCLAWQREGLGIPQCVRTATEEYRLSNDPLGDFFTERCMFADYAQTTAKALWDAYVAWAKENGVKWPLRRPEFGRRLEARGCQPHKGTMGLRLWRGIGLVTDAAAEAEDSGASGASGVTSGNSTLNAKSEFQGKLLKVTPLTPLTPLSPAEQRYADMADAQVAADEQHARNLAQGWVEVAEDDPQQPGGEFKLDNLARRSYVRRPVAESAVAP